MNSRDIRRKAAVTVGAAAAFAAIGLGGAASASADNNGACISGPFGYTQACVNLPGWVAPRWDDGPYWGPGWHGHGDGWHHGDGGDD